MLAKPENGHCKFKLSDFEIDLTCAIDVPVDWIKACIFAFQHGYPITVQLVDNGYEEAFLLFYGKEAAIIDNINGEKKLIRYKRFGLVKFAQNLMRDIKYYLDEWVNWYPASILGGEKAGRKEILLALLDEMRDAFANKKEMLLF